MRGGEERRGRGEGRGERGGKRGKGREEEKGERGREGGGKKNIYM